MCVFQAIQFQLDSVDLVAQEKFVEKYEYILQAFALVVGGFQSSANPGQHVKEAELAVVLKHKLFPPSADFHTLESFSMWLQKGTSLIEQMDMKQFQTASKDWRSKLAQLESCLKKAHKDVVQITTAFATARKQEQQRMKRAQEQADKKASRQQEREAADRRAGGGRHPAPPADAAAPLMAVMQDFDNLHKITEFSVADIQSGAEVDLDRPYVVRQIAGLASARQDAQGKMLKQLVFFEETILQAADKGSGEAGCL